MRPRTQKQSQVNKKLCRVLNYVNVNTLFCFICKVSTSLHSFTEGALWKITASCAKTY